jgi:hypothetical protein
LRDSRNSSRFDIIVLSDAKSGSGGKRCNLLARETKWPSSETIKGLYDRTRPERLSVFPQAVGRPKYPWRPPNAWDCGARVPGTLLRAPPPSAIAIHIRAQM